jgi:molybdopterin synthase sulfur carrier subunit
MKIDIRYFAWLRERTGLGSETVETSATTVAELIEDLKRRGEGHAAAFEDMRAVRVAVDQDLSDVSARLDGVREVAFFPPMTGG